MLLESLWRWRVALMATGVGVLAAMMRFVTLSNPGALVFDEVFYARGAYSLEQLGYEAKWEGENQDFANGDTSGLTREPDFVVHPMVGKILIAVGIRMFGPNPYGWRFSAALLGTLTVIAVALIARHLFQSTVWGLVAGVFLAVDGQHVVLSRTALLDIFLTFFVVVAFGLLLLDRHRSRLRLQARADAARAEQGLSPYDTLAGMGPGIGIRWWRLAAIVSLGLATGVKWSGLYFAAAFLALSVVWDLVDRREAGYQRWAVGGIVRAAIPAGLTTLVMIPVTYVATWWPWFASPYPYDRNWAQEHPGEGITWLPESLRSLAEYHRAAWEFHVNLDAEHNYQATAIGWLWQWRPTAFFFEDVPGGDEVCGSERCVSAIHALGNPLIWWAATAALAWIVWRIFRRGDLTALAVVIGLVGGWLPWFQYLDRTTFTFYAVAFSPWVVLMVVYALKRIAQPSGVPGEWSRTGTLVAFGFVAAVVIISGFFAPIWLGHAVPYHYWQMHMWLPSWI